MGPVLVSQAVMDGDKVKMFRYSYSARLQCQSKYMKEPFLTFLEPSKSLSCRSLVGQFVSFLRSNAKYGTPM